MEAWSVSVVGPDFTNRSFHSRYFASEAQVNLITCQVMALLTMANEQTVPACTMQGPWKWPNLIQRVKINRQ